MKQLSTQAIAELEIEEKFATKLWAYVPVLHDQAGAALGIAVANEGGYSPINPFWAQGTYDEMSQEADRLNRERGMEPMEALRIIATTMQGAA